MIRLRTFSFTLLPILMVLAPAVCAEEPEGEEMSIPAIDVEMRGTTLLWAGSPHRQEVALTFDDGPLGGKTEALLDILKDQGVPATFFVIGEKAKSQPHLIRRMVLEGHEIGNHTFTHPNLTKVSSKTVYRELNGCQEAIENAVGFRPTLFRAPYGAANLTVFSYLSHIGLAAVFWSIDTRDWDAKSAQQVQDAVLPKVKAGDVILFHEQSRHTAAALPAVIEGIRAKGFAFKTVSGMFDLAQPTLPPLLASAELPEATPALAKAEPVDAPAEAAPEKGEPAVTVEEPAPSVVVNEEKPAPAEAVAAAVAALMTPLSDSSQPTVDAAVGASEEISDPQPSIASGESTKVEEPQPDSGDAATIEVAVGAPAEPAPIIHPDAEEGPALSQTASEPAADPAEAASAEVAPVTDAMTSTPEVVVLAPLPVTTDSDPILPEIVIPARPAESVFEVSAEIQAPTLAYAPPTSSDPLGMELEKALASPAAPPKPAQTSAKKPEVKKPTSSASPPVTDSIRLTPDKTASEKPLTRLEPLREPVAAVEEPPVSPQKVRRLVPIAKPDERLVTPQSTAPTAAQPRPYTPRSNPPANSKRLLPPPEWEAGAQEAAYRRP